MDSPSMHGEVAGAAPVDQPKVDGQVQCGACPALFKPKKKWQHFCSTTCRNAFHTEEKRKEVVRKAGPVLYEALLAARLSIRGKDVEHAWINYPTEPALELGTLMDWALAKAGYKPPKP